jgi:nicotinate-nucleotide adenylyltransferase
MGLIFFRRAEGVTKRLGILPGAFNPPTVAHLALARAALETVDEVLFILPRAMPHKDYSGVSFEERLELLLEAAKDEPRFSVASSGGGLFIEIAREARAEYGERVDVVFLCGRDAAERIAGWDYGRAGAFEEMLAEFEMRVACRKGNYDPPPHLRERIQRLELADDYDHIAATEVRRRIGHDETWRALVPSAIADRIGELYSRLLS